MLICKSPNAVSISELIRSYLSPPSVGALADALIGSKARFGTTSRRVCCKDDSNVPLDAFVVHRTHSILDVSYFSGRLHQPAISIWLAVQSFMSSCFLRLCVEDHNGRARACRWGRFNLIRKLLLYRGAACLTRDDVSWEPHSHAQRRFAAKRGGSAALVSANVHFADRIAQA